MDNKPLLVRLVNKQFEMIGKPEVKIQDIENGIWLDNGKTRKVVQWWNVYFFPDQETYEKWKEWVVTELLKINGKNSKEEMVSLENDVNFIDLVYGMNVPIKKGSF